MSLGDVASKLPWPVFACDGEKRPIVATGFKAASRDAVTILKQFARPGAVMIGVPTGRASGLIVIDVDIKNGRDGTAWLEENADALPPTRTHKTRSGGLHLLFQVPAGIEIRNSASRVAPGIDVRGEGGYIIAPPSPGYQVADAADPAEMPRWLIRACLREEVPPAPQRTQERHERYTQAAIDGEVLAVIRAGEGTRNDTLNSSAVKLGTLVAAGQMTRSTAEAELQRAGQQAGLTPRECAATIKSGLDFGEHHPREMPAPRMNGATHKEARHEAPQPPGDGLPLVWFDDIEPLLDAKDFVQGVLVEQGSVVVYGESNAGKTFWTTDLSLHVAAGAEWNGRRVEQGGVIYCVLEGGAGFRNRVAAWRTVKGLQSIPFAAIPASLNLLDPAADTPRLIEAIKGAAAKIGMPVKLVVIDTLSRAMAGGNENAPDDMGALVQNMDTIRMETGACVVFIHHSGKDQAKGARGHSLLRAAIDTEVEVVASEGDDKSATIVKQRELKKGDVFGFTLKVVELGENRHGEKVTTCLVEPKEAGQPSGQNGTKRRLKLSPGGSLGVRALHIAMGKKGAHLPPLSEYPRDTVAVSATEWRDEYYQLKGGSADANKHAFNRAETELLAQNVITQRNGLVWFVSRKEVAQ